MKFDIPFFLQTFFTALSGVPVTLLMTAGALLIAVPVALFVAITRVNGVPVLKQLDALYVSFVRGTPVIVQIFMIYSILPKLLKEFVEARGLEINVYDINPIWYAILIFGFNIATHFAEIFRSALLSVPKGQKEAAYAVGFSAIQTYVKFIIPQAFVIASPSFCTASMNLLKNTSLAFMISVMDITGKAKMEAGIGYRYLEAYLDIFLVYIIICLLYEKGYRLLTAKAGKYQAKTMEGLRA